NCAVDSLKSHNRGGDTQVMQMPWQAPAEERDGLTWPEIIVVMVVLLVALAIAIPAILSR
ncbi:MAG TPA: prepilin-type N-terminal cleavage/methylation domain-containing protein, partial [Acidimicrobiales bacterium]|nr:prepilin-type N-terminal cleavage/methylation domain-containing protein [Acidimicrobiales bacterium]